jgi:hypothetical protein
MTRVPLILCAFFLCASAGCQLGDIQMNASTLTLSCYGKAVPVVISQHENVMIIECKKDSGK